MISPELKAMHECWLKNPHVSRGQYTDSKTILELMEQVERLTQQLAEAEEALKKVIECCDDAEKGPDGECLIYEHHLVRAYFAKHAGKGECLKCPMHGKPDCACG